LPLSLQCNAEVGEKRQLLAVEKLKNGWSFALYLRHLPWDKDCLRFTPGNPDHDRITGGKESAVQG